MALNGPVECALIEAIQVRIPRFARVDIIASISRFGQHLIARVFDRNRILLPDFGWLREYCVNRAILLPALLDEIEILSGRVAHAANRQVHRVKREGGG